MAPKKKTFTAPKRITRSTATSTAKPATKENPNSEIPNSTSVSEDDVKSDIAGFAPALSSNMPISASSKDAIPELTEQESHATEIDIAEIIDPTASADVHVAPAISQEPSKERSRSEQEPAAESPTTNTEDPARKDPKNSLPPEAPLHDQPQASSTSRASSKKRSRSAVEPDTERPAAKRSKDDSPGLVTPPGKGNTPKRYPSPPDEAATEQDKQNWPGWCEIESDPDYFTAMLRDLGVQGVCVREGFDMSVDGLGTLPQPVYGIVFLFRYREVDTQNQEVKCPDNVWFANQMPAQNSCGTLALINMLMNVADVDLGDNLQQFKEYSAPLNPIMRGEAFAGFEFVRNIHNSYATKMDMLQNDKHLASKVSRGKHRGRRTSQDSAASHETAGSFEVNAHHYIAFLPIDGKVWKLDGLDAQPTSIGEYDAAIPDHWKQIACHRIHTLMEQASDVDYTMLVVAQSPLARLQEELRTSIATTQLAESRLDSLDPEWKTTAGGAEGFATPMTPSLLEQFGVTPSSIAATTIPAPLKTEIEAEQPGALLERRNVLIGAQMGLPESIMAEMEVEERENEKAQDRKWDYGPVIRKWMEMLAENGYLEANLDRFMRK